MQQGNFGSLSFDPSFDEASYLSWVEKFNEATQKSGDQIMDSGRRRDLDEDKHAKLEDARRRLRARNC